MSPTLTILLVGSTVAASCALVGSFLVLRKLSLMGDAISHAVLPGIAIAFLLSGHRATLPMLIGAGALGVLTVFLVETLGRTRRMAEDASMGVVFPALFSIGVILTTRYAAQVDLDLDCVLYGEIAYSPWDLWLIGDRSLGPRPLWVSGGILLMNLAMVVLLFKELKLATFDPQLAAALGFSPVLVHYVLMSAVSVTVVGSFEAVGAILVVAMLIVPPATAYLLTDRLGVLIALSVALGIGAAVGGYGLARWWDSSIAGAMAVAAGIEFALAVALSPRHGLLARWIRRRRLGNRLAGQLLMMHLDHRGAAVSEDGLRRRFGWTPGRLARVLARLLRDGRVIRGDDGSLTLGEPGRAEVERAGGDALCHRP